MFHHTRLDGINLPANFGKNLTGAGGIGMFAEIDSGRIDGCARMPYLNKGLNNLSYMYANDYNLLEINARVFE